VKVTGGDCQEMLKLFVGAKPARGGPPQLLLLLPLDGMETGGVAWRWGGGENEVSISFQSSSCEVIDRRQCPPPLDSLTVGLTAISPLTNDNTADRLLRCHCHWHVTP